MCLLAVFFRCVSGAPLCIAANREEAYDRPGSVPTLVPGTPRILCGRDSRAGGTWLGINEYGVVIAVTNRHAVPIPQEPRSRGLLCLDLLSIANANSAASEATVQLQTGQYAGVNVLCADSQSAAVVSRSTVVGCKKLSHGIHIITNGEVDDPRDSRIQSAHKFVRSSQHTTPEDFVALSKRLCALPEVIIRRSESGTVSSQIICLTEESLPAMFFHAQGPPDTTPYEDLSTKLRELSAM